MSTATPFWLGAFQPCLRRLLCKPVLWGVLFGDFRKMGLGSGFNHELFYLVLHRLIIQMCIVIVIYLYIIHHYTII